MLNKALADEIVAETMKRLNKNVNIIDTAGKIIASGDEKRVGQFHEAALAAIQQDRTVTIRRDELHRWKGAQPGVNMPIRHQMQVIGAIGISGDLEEVGPFAELVTMTAELLIRQHYTRLQEDWKQMTTDLILEELLQDPLPGADKRIDERMELIRHPFQPPFRVAVVQFKLLARGRADESALMQIRRLFEGSPVLISHHRPQQLLLLFSSIGAEEGNRLLRQLVRTLTPARDHFLVGVGSFVQTRQEIRRSHFEAETALRCGGMDEGPIIRFEDVQPQALIGMIPAEHKAWLLDRWTPHMDPKTEQTLEQFFKCNFNLAETAKNLDIHRNTLIYRLARIKDLTGRDPCDFHSAVLFQMVIWLKRQKNNPK